MEAPEADKSESLEPEHVEIPLKAPEVNQIPTESLEAVQEKLKLSEIKINQLQDELRVKADFASELQKIKTNLENEVAQLRSQNKVAYESYVIKFANTEKSILDAKSARENAEKLTAKLQVKIVHILSGKMK